MKKTYTLLFMLLSVLQLAKSQDFYPVAVDTSRAKYFTYPPIDEWIPAFQIGEAEARHIGSPTWYHAGDVLQIGVDSFALINRHYADYVQELERYIERNAANSLQEHLFELAESQNSKGDSLMQLWQDYQLSYQREFSKFIRSTSDFTDFVAEKNGNIEKSLGTVEKRLSDLQKRSEKQEKRLKRWRSVAYAVIAASLGILAGSQL